MQRAATSPQDGAETAVIDDDLIAQSLVEEGSMTSKTSVALAEVTADAQTLRLSFKNIFCIDNLQGFNALTKLCLDNNIICAIENLDHLVNLQWLDLSFNNITKISGLDKLTKLTDVSLFSNMIGEIEGLDRCTDLQCLSLGNNRIVSLDSVQRLRKFKSLRLLNLEGNPVSKESEFRMYILAYLNGLTYLDYAMVVKSDVLTAREQYQDELLDLQEKEDLEDEKAAREQAAAKQTEKYKAANLVVVETIFAEMFAEDTENLKLKFLPGINDIVSNFQSEVEAASDKFLKDGLAKDEHKRDERAIFSEALHSLRASYEADSVGIIEAFNRRKKSDSRAFAGRDAVEASEVEPLVEELDSVQMKLMDLEMRQVEQFEDIMSEFDTKYRALNAGVLEAQQLYFRSVEDCENTYAECLQQLVTDLLDKASRDELGEALPEEAQNLLVDRDTCNNAINGSHDIHVGKLYKREEECKFIEMQHCNDTLRAFRDKEHNRNRSRITEIQDLVATNKRQLADLVSNEPLDEDDE